MNPKRVLLLAALALIAVPAAADAATCPTASTSAVFTRWGDGNQYRLIQGANFEAGASGWSWGGKADITKDDDAHLLVTSGSHAVNIPAGGLAKSPWTCVDATMPSMRFFVRRTSGTGNLTVQGLLQTSSGKQTSVVASILGSGTWAATAPIVFPQSFIDATTVGGINVQFQFVADPGSSFRLDDIYIDPYVRG
jgi:hypothetical protein